MLAPRKTLWTTPPEAVDIAFERVPLTEQDTVVDIGCGDGRVIMLWAKRYAKEMHPDRAIDGSPTFIGIDIESERILAAKAEWERCVCEHPSLALIDCQFLCANALDQPEMWLNEATVLFMYLIPRGLRLIEPLLTPKEGQEKKLRKVVSFMNKVPNSKLLEKIKVQTNNRTDVAWPLYIQELND